MKRIIFILTLLLLLVGCTNTSGIYKGETNTGDLQANTNFRTGSSSLDFSFIKSMPPKSIFVEDDFNIGVKLKNSGAYDVQNGFVVVSGFEQSAFDFSSGLRQDFSAVGRSAYRKEGETTQVIFDVKSLCSPAVAVGQVQNQSSSFRITACYPYQTIASSEVCVDPTPTQENEGDCRVGPSTFSGGQGGPVAVTKIAPKMFLKEGLVLARIEVEFSHANSKEEVYSTSFFDQGCNDVTQKGKFLATIVDSSGSKCEQELTFTQGRAKMSCNFPLSASDGTYSTPVRVIMDYSVAKAALTKVDLEKTVGFNVKECSGSETVTFATGAVSN